MDELEPLRRDAIRILSTALASDQLSVEQFESRLALVRQAPNRATLDAIVADVLPSGAYTLPASLAPALVDHTGYSPVEPAEVLRIATVFGSSKRGGSWTVPLRLELRVVFGELTIDLRDAVFGADVLDVIVQVTLGSLTLIVPAGAQVENECHERMSSSSHSTRSARGASPIGLLIRITGRVFVGSLDIKERRRTTEEKEPPAWKQMLGMGDD